MSKNTSPFIVAKKRQLQVSALSSMMLLASAATFAADEPKKDSKEPSKLSTVKVNADATAADFKADKVSSPKFTQPLVDTPQTIVVVKKELFQQQAATTLSETLRNTPGITMLLGENGNTATGDSIFMRGFDTQGSIFVDGIRDLGSISRDTFNTEQVEIAKGPAGVDNGRGAASGYVNLSSKLAGLETARSGNISGGSGDYARATLDINEALGDSSAIRVNLLKQDAGVAGRDYVENNIEGLATSLGLGLGTETRIHLNFLNVKQSGIPDGGISTIGLDGFYNTTLLKRKVDDVDTSNFYGSTSDHNDVHATMTTVRIEHDLADGVTIRNTSRYGRTNQDQVLTGVNGLTILDVNDPASWTVARSRQGKDQTNQILTNQTNLTAEFDTAGIKHELSGGIEFLYESQLSNTVGAPFTSPTSANRVTQANGNLYNPDVNDVFRPVIRDGAKTDGETTTTAFYVLDTVSLNEYWEISAGLRAENYHTKTDIVTRQGTTTPTQLIPVGTMVATSARADDQLFSWKLGGVFKPTERGSVYVSYATSQLPPGGANFSLSADTSAALNINKPNMDPQEGKNIEVGTKWNVMDDKLALTAAVFRSSNENEIATNPDGSSVAIGKKQVQGVELGATGIVMQNWQINAGLAYMDNEIKRGNRTVDNPTTTADESAGNNEGGAIQWTPKLTFTLWNSYTFSNGFILGGGARYIDTMVSSSITNKDALSRRSLPEFGDYWVFDAMASYPLNKNVSVQLNLMNLADEEYVGSLNNSGARYYPATPFSGRLGINFNF
ncbi:MAG TPA: catecholate siderophore receptor Fiu [Cellvibrio sp.]|nr:catecholate siderophore receptor Fiu [Cellvibrio sp.]